MIRLVIFPETIGEMEAILRAWRQLTPAIPLVIAGRKSAVVFGCDYFEGVVLDTSRLNRIHFERGTVVAEPGVTLSNLAWFCSENGIKGFEKLAITPGSVAGSLVTSNLFDHFPGRCTTDVFDLITGEIHRIPIPLEEEDYGYSFFKGNKRLVILKIVFHELEYANRHDLVASLRTHIERNTASLPVAWPSALVWRNNRQKALDVEKRTSTGIEISKDYPGFMVNHSHASTWKDILTLLYCAHEDGLPISTSYLEIITDESAFTVERR